MWRDLNRILLLKIKKTYYPYRCIYSRIFFSFEFIPIWLLGFFLRNKRFGRMFHLKLSPKSKTIYYIKRISRKKRWWEMTFTWDPIYTVNLVLCVIIFILGCWGYRKQKDTIPLYIGIAFGLFGISHLVILFDITSSLTDVLIIIRVLAYIIVIFALYLYLRMKAK